MRFGRICAVSTLWLAAACGGAPSSTTPAKASEPPKSSWEPPPLPTDGPIGMLKLTPPDKAWADMSYDEREWYMIGKVHPIMRQVFQTMDAAKYEGIKFECAPCHGENAKEKKYKMPSDHLSPIPAFDSSEYAEMRSSRIVKFMEQRVTPVMAQIMGEPAFDPATKQGFSCHECHPKQQ